MIVLAIGIDHEGTKHALDFEIGSSESKATVETLIERLNKRGLTEPDDRRLLVIRDGSAAIARAVSTRWGDVLGVVKTVMVGFRLSKYDHHRLWLRQRG